MEGTEHSTGADKHEVSNFGFSQWDEPLNHPVVPQASGRAEGAAWL